MKKYEILAPAGTFDALVAAVRCGANAVYLGGKSFNARRNAENFAGEGLKEAVKYCHERCVKVYLTLNTLASDNELNDVYSAVNEALEAGIDAFIVQDLGIASILKKICPQVPLHASTQMSVQSLEGIEMLKELGFSRVVLPRELSKNELIKIADGTDTELEYFVHGALCMCVSGQCLLSSALGGRSGNRGLCAQPCRLPFGIDETPGNFLSLKDSSLIPCLGEIGEIGVTSFKIEGRMKRPEYVAAAVTACKNSLCGIDDEEITNSLQAVFSRSGFTRGYYEGKIGKDMFGVRRKEDVTAAGSVLGNLAELYEKETPLLECNINFIASLGKPLSLTMQCGDVTVKCESEFVPVKGENKVFTTEEAIERLSKFGGTQFFAGGIDCKVDAGIFVSAGAVNALRRDAVTKMNAALSAVHGKAVISEGPSGKKCGTAFDTECKICIRVRNENQIPDALNGIKAVILPLDASEETVKRLLFSGIIPCAEIPRAYFSNGEKYALELERLKAAGVKLCTAGTLDGVGLAKKAGLNFVASFGMNVFNSESIAVLENLGARAAVVSTELRAGQIAALSSRIPLAAITYGRLPLMLCRSCPVKNVKNCAGCGGKSRLKDRKGIEFPVICSNGCSEILNSRPLYMADKPIKNTAFSLLWFTNETETEIERIIEKFRKSEAPEGDFTRGAYVNGAQ